MRSLGRGYLEVFERQHAGWRLSGWLLNPDRPTSVIRLLSGDEVIAESAPEAREDVGKAFPWIPHGSLSGFNLPIAAVTERKRVDVVALEGRDELVRMKTTLIPDPETLPMPPTHLIGRVIGVPDARFFLADGLRSFTEFSDAVNRFRTLGSIRRMLDWGCGCGRLSMLFLKDGTVPEIHGCDIDGEAVGYCQKTFSAERFLTVNPLPPTPYEDGFFDLVIGYSVFTHLDPPTQRAWLKEMRRIIAPGGLFLASVHGEHAARFALPQPERPKVTWRDRLSWVGKPAAPLAAGFFDSGEDHALDGIAPAGYYRGVFQTEAWTRKEWSPYFEVLEIQPAGMQNHQDLVVLRRPAG